MLARCDPTRAAFSDFVQSYDAHTRVLYSILKQ